MESLPFDVLELIALDLPLESLTKYCRSSKRFQRICENNNFWKRKLAKDYPDVNLEGIPEANYQSEYQRLYSTRAILEWQTELDNLDQSERKELENWISSDSEIQRLSDLIASLEQAKNARIDEIQSSFWEQQTRRKGALRRSLIRMGKLSTTAAKPHYIPLHLSFEDFEDLNNLISRIQWQLQTLLEKPQFKLIKSQLADDTLIGLFHPDSTDIPEGYIYIYRNPRTNRLMAQVNRIGLFPPALTTRYANETANEILTRFSAPFRYPEEDGQ